MADFECIIQLGWLWGRYITSVSHDNNVSQHQAPFDKRDMKR